MNNTGTFNYFAIASNFAPPPPKKWETKFNAITSIPRLFMCAIAREESKPPENNAKHFTITLTRY